MTWKPSCRTGGANFSYDGICADETVFTTMLKIDAPLKWKMKKFTAEEFESAMGSIYGSAR
ncbi:hypothetical protein DL96DRAFT_754766 [Flagelloscypha sp. PMI_526]|nr:hypothetical protein DL96DRAFT_754766 [Flagelloscypha sp. PMI_526]